jgi:hypothetical protein
VTQLNHERYDELERAIADGRRIALWRRGTEYIVIPLRLHLNGGREAIETLHPTTGESMTFYVDEMHDFQVIR